MYLVVDNIDTMVPQLQRTSLQVAIEQGALGGSKIADLLDAMVIAVRPETLEGYETGQQVNIDAQTVSLPGVVISTGLKKRMAFVRDALASEKR